MGFKYVESPFRFVSGTIHQVFASNSLGRECGFEVNQLSKHFEVEAFKIDLHQYSEWNFTKKEITIDLRWTVGHPTIYMPIFPHKNWPKIG